MSHEFQQRVSPPRHGNVSRRGVGRYASVVGGASFPARAALGGAPGHLEAPPGVAQPPAPDGATPLGAGTAADMAEDKAEDKAEEPRASARAREGREREGCRHAPGTDTTRDW